jgi:hypothetical protein
MLLRWQPVCGPLSWAYNSGVLAQVGYCSPRARAQLTSPDFAEFRDRHNERLGRVSRLFSPWLAGGWPDGRTT